ncbi:hypothetical protein [Marinomonas sp. 2405UD68-3]|uniref:hypothetical protein n=1 Tax=Marinomonas sp. 2405UD68-3 TaxID=3391835 RepID=UPI0039C90706
MDNLSESEEEKIRLEHEAAKLFMRCYEHDTGKEIRHIWHNRPMRPDVSCEFEGARLDLEIAHLYGSEAEAMMILGRELTEITRAALTALEDISVDDRLLSALNRILQNKAQKHYQSERVWLILRNAHPAWTADQIVALQHLIEVPEDHPFDQIWIVGDMSAASGIVRLYM